jgi:predicted nucleic acid-binding protein
VVLDTNVVIEYLRGNAKIAHAVDMYLGRGLIAITAVNRYELLQRVYKEQSVLSFVDEVVVYGFDKRASGKAAELWHRLKSKGKTVDDMDLLIASIAAGNGETLITLDGDFKDIGGDIEIITC